MRFLTLTHRLTAALLALASLGAACAPSTFSTSPERSFNAPTPMTTSTAATPSLAATRLTTLDVLGVGLSVEMFRQSQAWSEMQKHPKASILPTDASKYPTDPTSKNDATRKRSADALEWGAKYFVEEWPIPSVTVWPSSRKPDIDRYGEKPTYNFFSDRVKNLIRPAGMHTHYIASLGAFFKDEPEEVLERAFQFFELNPEVPALLLLMVDGDRTRVGLGDTTRDPFMEEGPRRIGAMTEAMVVLVLARRDRVDALRAYLPQGDIANKNAKRYVERDKQIAAAQAAGKPLPGQAAFKPSKFLSEPWTPEQIQQFDKLPTVGVLHRPTRVSYRKDKDGKPTFDPAHQKSLMHDQAQQAAFKLAFDQALTSIPSGKPARIFYDDGGPTTGRHVVPLSLAVNASLPGFDLFKPEHGYNIYQRLGNTGASSPFVQWALATIAGYHNHDASLTVNLRQKEEATITVVTPGNDTRAHPMGDPFDFHLAPLTGEAAVPVAPIAPRQKPTK